MAQLAVLGIERPGMSAGVHSANLMANREAMRRAKRANSRTENAFLEANSSIQRRHDSNSSDFLQQLNRRHPLIIRKLSMIPLTDVAAIVRVWPELMTSPSIKWEFGWSRRLRKFLIEV